MKKILFLTGFLAIFIPSLANAEELPAQVKSCLVNVFGQEKVNKFINGQAEASNEEKEKAKGCFQDLIQKKENANVKSDVKKCIRDAIGKNLEDLRSEPTGEEKQKIDKCFSGQDGAIAFPNETKACIKNVIGENRASQLLNGQSPTMEEKQKIGPKCFGQKGPDGKGPNDIPDQAKGCIEQIVGKPMSEMQGPPSEEQRKQIDEKCFGGKEREMAKERMKDMSDTDKECFKSVIGKSMEEAGPVSADQQRLVGEKCFNKTPEQATREEATRRAQNFTDTQRECLRNLFGKPIEEMGELNPEQNQQAGRCFAPSTPNPSQSPAPSQTEPTQAPTETTATSEQNHADPFPNLKPVTKECIASRIGLTVDTLWQGNYNDPNVNLIVQTCKDVNNEQ